MLYRYVLTYPIYALLRLYGSWRFTLAVPVGSEAALALPLRSDLSCLCYFPCSVYLLLR